MDALQPWAVWAVARRRFGAANGSDRPGWSVPSADGLLTSESAGNTGLAQAARLQPLVHRDLDSVQMSVGAAIALAAVLGLVLGIVVSVTTDVPLAPEAGLVLGAFLGWLWRRRAA